jgi:hypothetical protein
MIRSFIFQGLLAKQFYIQILFISGLEVQQLTNHWVRKLFGSVNFGPVLALSVTQVFRTVLQGRVFY